MVLKELCMSLNDSKVPYWFTGLEEEEQNFIKKFLLFSGSLKEIAIDYSVSYPTLRLRLDRIIEKIKLAEKSEEDTFILTIKNLAIDEKISIDVAKKVLEQYRKTISNREDKK
jgi:hypothetical protein